MKETPKKTEEVDCKTLKIKINILDNNKKKRWQTAEGSAYKAL